MRLLLAGFALVLAAGAQPRLVNAKLETRAVAGSLESSFRALLAQTTAPAWVGYAVPAVPGNHNMCCYTSWDGNSGYRGCGLEPGSKTTEGTAPAAPIRLEADREFHVLFRLEQKQVTRMRTFSSDCELDAGNTPVIWFTGVNPAENVALLASFVDEATLRESALSGIALTADPAAGAQLVKYLAAGQPEPLRRKAAFWIGAAHRLESLPALSQLALQDPSDRVRESAIQGLAMSREPSAIQTVLGIAKNDKSAQVRGRALFWLAQQAGEKASAAIQDAIENDPETKVKEEAVFALSRLPKDQSVPALIQLAKTSRNPAVKRKAMFCLGQSRDQRAVAFFAEVLSR